MKRGQPASEEARELRERAGGEGFPGGGTIFHPAGLFAILCIAMAMSRTTSILLVVLAVAVIGGGVYFWLNKDKVASLFNSNQANTNALAENTNHAIVNGSVQNVEGQTPLQGQITVGDTTLTVTSMTRDTKFESLDAPKDQDFVVVFFNGVSSNKVFAVQKGLMGNADVSDGKTSYALEGLKVASDLVANDHGYLKFVVPHTASKLTLEVGSGPTAQRLQLP